MVLIGIIVSIIKIPDRLNKRSDAKSVTESEVSSSNSQADDSVENI